MINKFPLFLTLLLRYNPTSYGIIKGKKNLPKIKPLSSKNFSEKNYDYEFCVKKTKQILENSIDNITQKKIAIGLSGGTDSSLNSILLSKRDDISLKLFCIGFGDSQDEFKDARKIAKLTNCDYHEIIIKNIVDDMPLRVWEYGSVKSNLWPYYNYKIVKQLGAKTSISGEGGDELFGGYYFRYENYLQYIPNSPNERAKRYIFSRSRDWIKNYHKMFGPQFKNQKFIFDESQIILQFLPNFKNNLSFLNQIFLADFNMKLRFDFNLIDYIFSKNEKIKVISPFLTPSLIKLATHIPTRFKVSHNTSKMILRDILKTLGAPKSIYTKPKQGWGMKPITIWKNGLDEKCIHFLLDGNIVRDNWIDAKWIKETYKKIEKEKNHNPSKIYPLINKIWDLIAFEIFYIQRILKESKNGKISSW